MIFLGLFLIIYGLICNALNIFNGDILMIAGLAVLIVKIYFLFVREDKKKRKASQRPVAEPQNTTEPDQLDITPPKPKKQPIYQTVFNVAGVTFRCQKDTNEKRQDVLLGITEASPLILEEYEFKEEPAYLVVDYVSDLDIGNVPKDITKELNEKYYGMPTDVMVESIDNFLPDDSTEEIIYCRVRLQIYE